MLEGLLGFQENPKNGLGIIRARTTGQIRSWEFIRDLKALEKLNMELGKIDFPGLYILIEGKNKIYIGEAKNIYKRIKTHILSPEEKIEKWEKVLIINDGRPATQSDFNDTVIRRALEFYLIKLFKANRFTVTAQGEKQNLNSNQDFIFQTLKIEIDFFLRKKNLIFREIEGKNQQEIFSDEIEKILKSKGFKIEKVQRYSIIVNNEEAFIRPGSKKPRGWQITFRGRKSGSFIDSLQNKKGYLLFSRNGLLLIPLSEVDKVIKDKTTYQQDTVDIWISFIDNKITLSYKQDTIDITHYKLVKD